MMAAMRLPASGDAAVRRAEIITILFGIGAGVMMDRGGWARRGGWLPTLQVGARRGQQRDLSQAGADDPRLSTDDDLTLDATLTFRLDRAAYGPDEVALAREERTRELERQERYRVVIAAYYERRRLQLERDLMGRHDVLTAVRIRELAALLDAFTGGAFTRGTRRRAEGLRP